jgi:pimeloyl-ACP methyl ester carboxylesterase
MFSYWLKMQVNHQFKFLLQLTICLIPLLSFSQTVDFSIQDITFESHGVKLAGSILMPKKPTAAVVIIHGSDPVKRELEFAKLLAKEGIAVLTYDKRGVGESGGVYVGPSFGTNNIDPKNLDLLADDGSVAIDTLKSIVNNKNTPIGLLGFSQAGWIIPIAAEKNSSINFMVIFSGPVITTLEQLRFQFYTNGDEHFWDKHSESEAREHIKNDPDRYQFEPTDPQLQLSKLRIPGLWIFGGRDIQIPTRLCIDNLNKQIQMGKQYEYLLYPSLGHSTAFSNSPEPVNSAIQWIKSVHNKK